MQIPSIEKGVQASELPLDHLAQNPKLSENQKVHEVSRQFEALLLRQILHDAQKTVIPSRYGGNSSVNSIYQDLSTAQLADSISKSGGFGLAGNLEKQLGRQLLIKDSASAISPGEKPKLKT
ncbi:MAG: rod-binding protein [Verrucomicrobiota bacterium]